MAEKLSSTSDIWDIFAHEYQLSASSLAAFKQYAILLQSWATRMNLTTLLTDYDIVAYHFMDSLAVCRMPYFASHRVIADVGTGAGFPGMPLALYNPDKKIYLIEVNQKKVHFLHEVIAALNLCNVTLITDDWRTFLRSTTYPIDLFCARASLSVDELLRLFSPSSHYHTAGLVYWASIRWEPTASEASLIKRQDHYGVGTKQRKLVYFTVS